MSIQVTTPTSVIQKQPTLSHEAWLVSLKRGYLLYFFYKNLNCLKNLFPKAFHLTLFRRNCQNKAEMKLNWIIKRKAEFSLAEKVEYFWYVDNTFAIFNNEEDCKTFLTHFNSLHPSLRFTYKKESETLLFLCRTTCYFYDPTALSSNKKDVLPSHHHSNVIYHFVCHCNSRYVGRTSQRLEELIKQHVPKSIANPPISHNRQSLSRSCKANIIPQQFHKSAIGQHLLDNAQCALQYNSDKFSVLARSRSSFHLSARKATFIKSLNPRFCKQKKFFYSKNFLIFSPIG